MKPKTGLFWRGVGEALLELLAYGVAFLIGAVIVGLFGFNLDDPSLDGELIVLIGLVVPLVVFAALAGIVTFCVKKVKKALRARKENK